MANKHTFIAGHYEATIKYLSGSDDDAFVIGTTENGFTINEMYLAEPVINDDWGSTTVTQRFMGKNITVTLDYMEYNKIVKILYPRVGIPDAPFKGSVFNIIGRDVLDFAFELTLTPVGGNAAKKWVFFKCIVLGDVPTVLGSGLRKGPIAIEVYPTDNTESETPKKNAHYAVYDGDSYESDFEDEDDKVTP